MRILPPQARASPQACSNCLVLNKLAAAPLHVTESPNGIKLKYQLFTSQTLQALSPEDSTTMILHQLRLWFSTSFSSSPQGHGFQSAPILIVFLDWTDTATLFYISYQHPSVGNDYSFTTWEGAIGFSSNTPFLSPPLTRHLSRAGLRKRLS